MGEAMVDLDVTVCRRGHGNINFFMYTCYYIIHNGKNILFFFY